MAPPVLGDGDEPLGTGVLGDLGSAAHDVSGDVTAYANLYGFLRHSFRGADGDKRRQKKRDKQRSWDRLVAANRAREQAAREQAAVDRRRRLASENAETARRQAQRAAKVSDIQDIALRLQAVRQARLRRDDEDMAVLLLVA